MHPSGKTPSTRAPAQSVWRTSVGGGRSRGTAAEAALNDERRNHVAGRGRCKGESWLCPPSSARHDPSEKDAFLPTRGRATTSFKKGAEHDRRQELGSAGDERSTPLGNEKEHRPKAAGRRTSSVAVQAQGALPWRADVIRKCGKTGRTRPNGCWRGSSELRVHDSRPETSHRCHRPFKPDSV